MRLVQEIVALNLFELMAIEKFVGRVLEGLTCTGSDPDIQVCLTWNRGMQILLTSERCNQHYSFQHPRGLDGVSLADLAKLVSYKIENYVRAGGVFRLVETTGDYEAKILVLHLVRN